ASPSDFFEDFTAADDAVRGQLRQAARPDLAERRQHRAELGLVVEEQAQLVGQLRVACHHLGGIGPPSRVRGFEIGEDYLFERGRARVGGSRLDSHENLLGTKGPISQRGSTMSARRVWMPWRMKAAWKAFTWCRSMAAFKWPIIASNSASV